MADIISKPVGTTSDFGDLDYCFFYIPDDKENPQNKELTNFSSGFVENTRQALNHEEQILHKIELSICFFCTLHIMLENAISRTGFKEA